MQDILEIINKNYAIQPLSFKEKVKLGYLSNNFILENRTSKYFLKEYRIKEEERIKEIHAAKFFFAEQGIPIILPLRQGDGSTFFQTREKYYALFPFVEGRIIRRTDRSPKAMRSAGAMLGKIHSSSKKELPDSIQRITKNWNRDWFLAEKESIKRKILEIPHPTAFDHLALKTIELKTSIVKNNNLNFADLNLQNNHLIHGDYHGLNIFFDKNDKIEFVFDLEKSELAPRSYEIARAIDFMYFSNNYNESAFEGAQTFLASYHEIYPVTPEELLQGFTFYYLKKAHSLWLENEHYFENNHRTDVFLETEFEMLHYCKTNLEAMVRGITR